MPITLLRALWIFRPSDSPAISNNVRNSFYSLEMRARFWNKSAISSYKLANYEPQDSAKSDK